METLLSDGYNDKRRQLIGDMAAMQTMAGQVDGYEPFAIDRPKGQTEEGRNNTSMGERQWPISTIRNWAKRAA